MNHFWACLARFWFIVCYSPFDGAQDERLADKVAAFLRTALTSR